MPQTEIEYVKVASAQFIQFILFLGAVAAFSIINKMALTREESWSFFPLILFFYGLEYHLLDKIDTLYATIFSLIFAGIIFGAYQFAKRISDEMFASADMIYTTVAGVLAHSIYFVQLNDQLKILLPFLTFILIYAFQGSQLRESRFQGALLILSAVTVYSFGLLMAGSADVSTEFLVVIGLIYGAVLLLMVPQSRQWKGSENRVQELQLYALLFAHSQILLAVYRMKTLFLDRSFVAPIWVIYAFALIFTALRMRDKTLARSSFPVIALGLIRFMLVDFYRLDSGTRILSLLIMGGLIFAGGYLYKKISINSDSSVLNSP